MNLCDLNNKPGNFNYIMNTNDWKETSDCQRHMKGKFQEM